MILIKYFLNIIFAIFLFFSTHVVLSFEDVRSTKLLNEVVFIQTHDSMTGEFDPRRDRIMTKLAKTQNGTILDQLNCGARALDYRPYYANDGANMFAHHGPIVVHKDMKDTLLEVRAWGKLHPSELVVISLSHCVTQRFHNYYYADECYEAALRILSDLNVHTITNCEDLIDMTYADALKKGNILAVWGCSYGFWDPSITCYGVTEDKSPFTCYETDRQPSDSMQIPWNKLTSFLETNTATLPPIGPGTFWNIGGNWQSSVESDTLAILHNSSLVLDEVRSGVNLYLAKSISENKFKFLNMLGVDNVCDHGLDIVDAINAYYYPVHAATA